MGKYKIKVIRDKCISAASCVGVAPKVFELYSENIAVIKDENGDTPENIMLAAQSCPTNAIEIYDEAGSKLWPKE